MSVARRLAVAATLLAALFFAGAARADGLTLASVDTALTAFEQKGFGFQSKAGPLFGPGSERLTVFQPQLMAVFRQGPRFTHRIWVPIDMVTSASANAIDNGRGDVDTITQASRQNESLAVDWTTTYEAPKRWTATIHDAVHIEENFRSWSTGLGMTASIADDNAVVAANANQILDWFTRYDSFGFKYGRTTRSTTNGNAGITQILGPTTVVHANYGISAQYGELGNTWNSVGFPLLGRRYSESLPDRRIRHAVVGRFAQFLPWNGALKGFYRYYRDDWGLVAHAVEGQLLQRLTPWLYVRGTYRFYRQNGVSFFTPGVLTGERYFTADSDLGHFDSHTVGGKVTFDVPIFRGGHVDAGYERYWRTDGLRVNVALWQAGARF